MINEFCGFKHGVIGTDKLPADTTLNNMKKSDLIKLLHTAQHNYETLMWFYNNAVKFNEKQLNGCGWIPVSERLPEAYGNYNVSCKNDEGKEWTTTMVWMGGMFGGQESYHRLVVAWQPLPEPYKESEGHNVEE